MPIYTGTANANGDFNISFGQNYTSGEKVIVIAEKDNATKSIELYAPSSVVGGGVIQFSGNMSNFPANIGNVTLTEGISGPIGRSAFDAYSNENVIWRKATGLTVLGAVTSIGIESFRYWSSCKNINLPSTLLSIGDYAFDQCSSLESLVIPPSCETIGTRAFYFCPKLLTLDLGNIRALGDGAFFRCDRLLEINIPDSLSVINNQSFYSCNAVKKITIGAGVTSIGYQAFANATSCNEIIVRSATPPKLDNQAFLGLKSGCVFKVPAGSVDAYKSAANWSDFAARIQAI